MNIWKILKNKCLITLHNFCRNIYEKVNIEIRKIVQRSPHDTKERMDE